MADLQKRIEERNSEMAFDRHFAYNAALRLTKIAGERNFRNVVDAYRDSDNHLQVSLIEPTFKFWLKGRRAQFTSDIREKIASHLAAKQKASLKANNPS